MHRAVEYWRGINGNDAAILGLIALYDDCNQDANRVMQLMKDSKAHHLKAKIEYKIQWARYSAAAVLLVLLGFSGWWFFGKRNKITWSYKDEGIPQYMDEHTGTIDWSSINFCFQKERYEDCVELMNEAMTRHPNNDTLMYYSAYCYLQMEERDSARKYFSLVPKLGSVYSIKAQYFTFHLVPQGPDYKSIMGLSNVQDPMLRMAVKKDIVN